MRRRLVPAIVMVLVTLLVSGIVPATAQNTEPADAMFPNPPALPELRVTATDTGYEGVPGSVEAGWYLLTLDNQSSGEVGLEFLGVPPGMTADELIGLVTAIVPPAAAGATPAEGSTAAEAPEAAPPPPDFLYQVHLPGGPYAEFPGQTVQAVVELRPGDYMVWAGLPGMPQAPAPLTVTAPAAATPAAAPEIEADLTITQIGSAGEGYTFDYEGTLLPGPQVVEVFNPSDQPHFVAFIKAPGPITQEEAVALLSTPPGATPAAGLPDPAALFDAGGTGTQSAGTTQWVATNLEPGYYIVACFITDPAAGHIPHAFEGMIDVIEVGAPATPAS